MKAYHYIEANTATDAFETAYNRIETLGEVVESRIGKTKHLTDVTIEIKNPYHNVCLNPQRNMSLKYMLGEIDWYLSGSNKVADIAKYGKMWNSLTDDGETVNSAYGYRIFEKFGFSKNLPSHFPLLLSLVFLPFLSLLFNFIFVHFSYFLIYFIRNFWVALRE